MIKKELIRELSKELNFTNSEATKITDVLLDIILDELKNSGKVVISGFGTFEVRTRKARNGRDPSTNEVISLPETKTVLFKVSKKVKNEL